MRAIPPEITAEAISPIRAVASFSFMRLVCPRDFECVKFIREFFFRGGLPGFCL